jgi:hypothetical protein
MKFLSALAAVVLIGAPAFAEPSCNPGTDLKPVWESMKAFEEAGGKVVSFKTNEGGCYEIYGVVEDTKMEVFYDPNTGIEIGRQPA